MSNPKKTVPNPVDELIDVLLDFIIVAANLTKQLTCAAGGKQIEEGEMRNVEAGRSGGRDQRPAVCGCRH